MAIDVSFQTARSAVGPNFDSGGGGPELPGNQRWREFFPLPSPPLPFPASGDSVSSRRRKARVRERVQEANKIGGCLNKMYASVVGHSMGSTTAAQSSSQRKIFQQLGRFQKPNKPCTVREAVQELLHSDNTAYNGSTVSSSVRPFNRDLLSLPDVGAHLVPLPQVLDPVGRDLVGGPLENMMVDEDTWGNITEQNKGFRPYMDQVLSSDPKLYQEFVRDLYTKNLVICTNQPADVIAPFFVAKKMGRFVWFWIVAQLIKGLNPHLL